MTAPQTGRLPDQLRQLDAARLQQYRQNLDFYHGRQWLGSPRRRERRLTFNYARAVVDKTAAYLMFGRHPVVDSETDDAAGRADAQRKENALKLVWEANNLDALDYETEIDAAILGDGAFKVTWDERRQRVRVTAPDVQGLFAWWRPDDLFDVWRVAQRWTAPAADVSRMLGVAVGSTRPDGLVTVIEDWTDEFVTVWVDSAVVDSRPNPYGFVPYVVFANLREAKSFWGVSDVAQLVEPARELNRAMSQLSSILELSGNPVAVLENVTDSTDIAVAPGAVWELPADARAYLLDLLAGGGVKLHTDYVDLIYRTLHDLGETPRTAFGENKGALSGVALNTELDPLLKKVQRKRLIRSAAYRRRNELIMRLLEQFTGEPMAPYRSRIVWGAVLPQDRSRQVMDERELIASGIHSRRRAADELGVEDPEAEFTRWLEEEKFVREVGADQTQVVVTQREGSAQ